MEAGAPLVEFPDAGGGGGGSVVIPGDGDGPGDGDTAPEIPPPEDETFEGLVGTFLMRFDEDTFTSSSSGGVLSIDLNMNNRVTRFVLAEIVEEDGQLVSTEWLCHQTHQHVCKSTQCVSATTQIFPSAAKLLPTALPIKRTLKLGDDGTLSAPLASTYLGFDASSNNNPPTSTSDPRMWDPLPGTSGREGLYTDLSITVKPNAIIAAETVRCQLSIVQKLETGWSVRVREGDTHALHGKSGKFQVGPATGGSILDAKANPSSRLDDCKGNNASSKDKTTVLDSAAHFHFLSSARVRTCPKVEEFEAVLKPNNPEP